MIVGYKLMLDGIMLKNWGGVWGTCPPVPNPVILPNGDVVYGPKLNEDLGGGVMLVEWDINPPEIGISDVAVERQRRLSLGFDYDFGAAGMQHVGTTEEDMKGWSEVTTWANAQLALGNTTATVTILTDSGVAQVTPLEWMQVLGAASAFRQPIWQASFALSAMQPIPADYKDDKWW